MNIPREEWNDGGGWCVGAAGDVVPDGVPDFFIGAPTGGFKAPGMFGRIRIYSGASGAIMATHAGQ